MPQHKACKVTKRNKRNMKFRKVEGFMRLLRRIVRELDVAVASEDFADAEKMRIQYLDTYREIQLGGITPFPLPYKMTIPFVK